MDAARPGRRRPRRADLEPDHPARAACRRAPRRSFVGQHPLRKAADPRVGAFLRRLALVRASRIRHQHAALPARPPDATRHRPAPGAAATSWAGSTPADALDLLARLEREWPAAICRCRSSRASSTTRFLIRGPSPPRWRSTAARPVTSTQWQIRPPGVRPVPRPPLVQAEVDTCRPTRSESLDARVRQVLETIAAFRMPAS